MTPANRQPSLQQNIGEFVIEACIIKGIEKSYPLDAENIGQQFLNILDRIPERIWQIDSVTGETTTYKTLKERSIRLAIWMRKEGIVTGDIISVCSPNHPDVGIIILAAIFAGSTFNALSIESNAQTTRHFINFIKPRIIFASKDKVEVLQKAAALESHNWRMIVLGTDHFDDISSVQLSNEIDKFLMANGVNSTHIVSMMLTSVSTYTKLNNNTSRVYLYYFEPEWELYHQTMLHSILIGHTLVFHAEFDPRETCKIIEKYKVNALNMEVYQATLLCRSAAIDNYDLQTVSAIRTSDVRILPEVVKKLSTKFHNAFVEKMYGATETYLVTNYTKNCRNPKSQGTVLANVQLKISDVKTGLTLGQNEIGEIRVKTPFGMTGYYNNPEANKLAFDSEGWFCMGDQGYYDENGEIFINGRIKELIKCRLYDIYPSQIEELLLSHRDIVDAGVVGIDHEIDIERPIAFVKITAGSVVTEEDILKLLTDLEYSDALKDSIIFVDEIPRSTNGKIKRRILKARAEKLYESRQNNA